MYLATEDAPTRVVGVDRGEPLVASSDNSGRELAAAFALARLGTVAGAMRGLDLATTNAAHRMRDAGLRPEQGIAALKALLRGTGSGWEPSLVTNTGVVAARETELYAHVFHLWLATYYDA